jgi:formate dehydrogenase gamma subunit
MTADSASGPPHPSSAPRHPSRTVRRFALATRLLHWLNALTFLLLLASGLLLFYSELKSSAIGGYRLLPLAHIVFGIAFIAAPPLVLLLARRRRAVADDLAAALTPRWSDAAWLNYAALTLLGAKVRPPRTGKYNAGQKLNSWYWLVTWVALGATGAVLAVNFFTKSVFDAAFVEAVFPLHEVIALLSIVPLALHLYLALVNRSTRPALRGIVRGDVDAAWAREHHADWLAARIKEEADL